MAIDATGAVYVAGYVIGAMDFGLGDIPELGGADVYLVKLAP